MELFGAIADNYKEKIMVKLYSEIRNQLQTGDLLAWKVTRVSSFFSFILFLYQKIFKVEFSHVGIVLKLEDRYFLVEATPPRVRIYPVSMCDDFYYIKTNVKKNNKNYVPLLLKHIGKSYSIFDLVKGMLNMKSSDKSLYCSELAYDFYKEVGFITDESSWLTPQALVDKVVAITDNQPIFVSIDRGNAD